MNRKRLLIQVSPHRFRAAVIRGSDILDQCEATIPLQEAGESLERMLAEATPNLIAFSKTHRLAGSQAVILHSSTSASFGVYSCPLAIGPSGALEAAMLALEEAAEFPLALNPHQMHHLFSDAQNDSNTDPASLRTHVFGLAETNEVAQRLCQWAVDCGLQVQALLPTTAITMLAAVQDATTTESQNTRIILHMAEDNSVLAAARNGSLKFVRTISTGTDALVDALTTTSSRSLSDPLNALSRDEAQSLLMRLGIPENDDAIDAETGISAKHVLPLLQPILQRCAIETKQSIRFGLAVQERDHSVLSVTGIGAHIPGLLELIARQSAVEHEHATSTSDNTGSTMGAFVSLKDPPPGLVSHAVRSKRRLHRARLAMGLGLCAASLFMGAQAYQTHTRTENARRASMALDSRLESNRPMRDATQRLANSQALLTKANAMFAQAAQGQARWDAVLALCSISSPEQVTFSRMNMSQDDGQPFCSVSGEVRADTETSARTIFSSLVDNLAQSPIVNHCSIASTNKDRVDPGILRFELRLTLAQDNRPTISLATAQKQTSVQQGGQP